MVGGGLKACVANAFGDQQMAMLFVCLHAMTGVTAFVLAGASIDQTDNGICTRKSECEAAEG